MFVCKTQNTMNRLSVISMALLFAFAAAHQSLADSLPGTTPQQNPSIASGVWSVSRSSGTGTETVSLFDLSGSGAMSLLTYDNSSSSWIFSPVTWSPNEINLGPGFAGLAVEWTAQTTGRYLLSGSLVSSSGGVLQTAGDAQSPGAADEFVPYSRVVDVTTGDTIDVLSGSNSNTSGGMGIAIQFGAVVPQTPEPSALVALCGLGGAGCVVLIRRGRRRRTS
jgi:hypothetical protein